jgi:hypothetical protein
MHIVTADECHAWASARLQEPFSWLAMERAYSYRASYLLPNDTGKKTALTRALISSIDSPGEGLLWVTEWGVFPSCENMALFDGYRRSLGEERSLHAAPGHVFEGADVRELECLTDLVLYFFWSAAVIDAGASWLRISHDEVLTINTRDSAAFLSWEDRLADFDLKQLSRTA